MKREIPKDALFEQLEKPGDSFIVLADTVNYEREKLDKLISVVREAYEVYVKSVLDLTKDDGIGVDIKTIIVVDDHSQP